MLEHSMSYTMLAKELLASGKQDSIEDAGVLSSRDVISSPPLPVEVLLGPCLLVPATR